MQWIVLVLIVVGLLLMATRYPKIAFGILGALVLLIGILLMLGKDNEQDASSRAAQLKLINTQMTPGYADSYQFTGRISNQSETTIRQVTIQVTLKDCDDASAEDASCSIIGEELARVTVTIPPGQARDFSDNVYLGSSKPKRHARWQFLIVDAQIR